MTIVTTTGISFLHNLDTYKAAENEEQTNGCCGNGLHHGKLRDVLTGEGLVLDGRPT